MHTLWLRESIWSQSSANEISNAQECDRWADQNDAQTQGSQAAVLPFLFRVMAIPIDMQRVKAQQRVGVLAGGKPRILRMII